MYDCLEVITLCCMVSEYVIMTVIAIKHLCEVKEWIKLKRINLQLSIIIKEIGG